MCTGKSLEENAAKSYQKASLKLGVQGTSPSYIATTAHGLLTMTAINFSSQEALTSFCVTTKTLRALSLPHFSGDRPSRLVSANRCVPLAPQSIGFRDGWTQFEPVRGEMFAVASWKKVFL